MSDVIEGLAALAILALAAGYAHGLAKLWRHRGTGGVVSVRRAACFAAGLLALIFADAGPLGDTSFASHMAQHMLLLVVAGPLLAAGSPGLPLMLALPPRARPVLVRLRLRRHRMLIAGAVHAVVLWGWHLPVLYVAALANPVVHAAEHASFTGAAWLLWSRVRPLTRPSPGAAPLLAATTMAAAAMTAAALGAVLTFAPVPLYPPIAYGTDPLTDQQMAGLAMWVPMDVVSLTAALILVGVWLRGLDRRMPAGREKVAPTAPAVREAGTP